MGELVVGICHRPDRPEGGFYETWTSPERAEALGEFTRCREGGTEVVQSWELHFPDQEFEHTWRYDENGALMGETERGDYQGAFACCTETDVFACSGWSIGTLEECTPVEEPEGGCDHARTTGSVPTLAVGSAMLWRRRRRA